MVDAAAAAAISSSRQRIVARRRTVNGFKIGQVSNITLNSDNQAYLIVEIALEEKIEFTDQSILEIYDSDIMGSKSLQLKISNKGNIAINGDTLKGTIATGLTSEMSEQFGSVKVGLDQLIISFNKVLKEVEDLSNSANRILLYNEQKVANSIDNVEAISGVIEKQAANINNTIINISDLTDQLSKIDLITFSNQMTSISQELDDLIFQINKEEGSLGKLLNNDSLYNDLSSTIQSLEQLIDDIKLNPKKYVNISIWGKDK